MISSLLVPLRISLVITMLSYASYKDLKSREVSDWVWLVFGAISVPLDAWGLLSGELSVMGLALALGFSVVLSISGWFFGLFGGADLLAFIVVSALSPLTPSLGFPSVLFPPLFFPLSVVSDAVVFAGLSILLVLGSNLLSSGLNPEESAGIGLGKRLGLMLTARLKRLDSLRGPPFEYPLEYVDVSGEVKVKLRPDLSDDSKALETLQKLRDAGREKVFVTYTLPFLLFLLFGYLAAVTLGDILLWLVSGFLGG